MSADIFSHYIVKPFAPLGLTSDFWSLHIDILLASWIAMAVLFALCLVGRYYMKKELNLITLAYQEVISIFIGLCNDSFPSFNYNYFIFISTMFFFTFFSCLVGILPFVEEAAKDLNTTFALGLTSFLFVQYHKIKVHGIGGFIKEFFQPFFVMAPMHIVGELSKIASMSFRLFGNILGGGVILMMILDLVSGYKMYYFALLALLLILGLITKVTSAGQAYPWLDKFFSMTLNVLLILSWLHIFLGIFEGLIQSFVITMLTTTYLAIGTQHDPSHEKHHETKELA